MTLAARVRRLRNTNQDSVSSDFGMPSSTALQLLRAFTFQPGGRISIGYSPWKTTVLVLTRHFQGRVFGVFRRLDGKEHPGNGPWTRILQEGHRMASRPNLAGVDTRDGDRTFYFTLPAAD